jgi:4-amino-4-deoxy-L-arabinose transferase-like glycosyltransferase
MQASPVGKSPLSENASGPEAGGAGGAWKLALVGALSAVLVGLRLGAAPLLDPDEARHALAALEMFERGAWLEPTLNGEPYHHKLSLFYVLIGGCYRTLGVVETAARLVPALSAWLTVMAVHRFASTRSATAGLLAPLLLCCCGFFVLTGRFVSFDATFSLFLTLAALCGAQWFAGPPGRAGRSRLDWLCLFTGMAALIKGPAALVLVGLPLVAETLRSGRSLGELGPSRSLLIVGGVISAWFVPAALMEPEYVREFIVVHNFERFLGGSSVFHPEPLWFFGPVLVLALLPWSLFVPQAVAAALRRNEDNGRCFLATYSVWVVVFFSLSSGKLATYILPAVPALAIVTADWIVNRRREERGAGAGRLEMLAALILASTLPLSIGLLLFYAPAEITLALIVLPASSAGFALLALRHRFTRGSPLGVGLLSGGTALTVLLVNAFAPAAIGRFASDRDLAELSPPPAAHLRRVSYRVQPYSFLFYSRGPLEIVYGPHSVEQLRDFVGDLDDSVLLTKTSRLTDLDFAAAGIEVETLGSNARHLLLRLRAAPQSTRADSMR